MENDNFKEQWEALKKQESQSEQLKTKQSNSSTSEQKEVNLSPPSDDTRTFNQYKKLPLVEKESLTEEVNRLKTESILPPKLKEVYIDKCNHDPKLVNNDLIVIKKSDLRIEHSGKIEPSGIGFYILLAVIAIIGLLFVAAIFMGYIKVDINQPITNNADFYLNNTNAYSMPINPTIINNNNYTIRNEIKICGNTTC
jgi:hypothetical protein